MAKSFLKSTDINKEPHVNVAFVFGFVRRNPLFLLREGAADVLGHQTLWWLIHCLALSITVEQGIFVF